MLIIPDLTLVTVTNDVLTHIFEDFRSCEFFSLSSQSLVIQVNVLKTFA